MPKHIYVLPDLPPPVQLEIPEVMNALTSASRALEEFKGEAKTIPNQDILLNMLFLQEALASSEIKNIVTTEDELFQVDLFPNKSSLTSKEVARYRDALRYGFEAMKNNSDIIANNLLIKLFEILKQQQDGFRKTQGTILRNEQAGQDVYTPPQDYREIVVLMTKLEYFVNNHDVCSLDPLIKMTIIHHQFESIHPFYNP